jgi:hypothetical protein
VTRGYTIFFKKNLRLLLKRKKNCKGGFWATWGGRPPPFGRFGHLPPRTKQKRKKKIDFCLEVGSAIPQAKWEWPATPCGLKKKQKKYGHMLHFEWCHVVLK